MAATTDNRFIHSKSARLIALIAAILFAVLFFMAWGGQVSAMLSKDTSETEMMIKGQALNSSNAALDDCLKTRIGHVDALKEEGTINASQYAKFKERAEALCQAQNPS